MELHGLFGHVNDSIRGLATDGAVNETWEFICECPDVTCHTMVSITLVEFDRRRASSPPVPIMAEHHDDQAVGVGSRLGERGCSDPRDSRGRAPAVGRGGERDGARARR